MGCETSCELQPITKKSEPDQPAQDTQRKPKSSKPAAKVGKYGKGVSLAMFWLIGFWFLQHYFPLIYKTRFPCWCEAEVEKDTPEEYVTRNDQFNLKPEKAPRERGRGRARGRGRGRNGRGEGAGRGTENGGRGRGRGRNVSKNKAGQSADWDENKWWDETWQEGWGYEGEEWAQDGWGTPGYYWDSYAWQDGKQSLHNLAGQNEGTPKTSKVEKSKPESSKPESSKPATKRLKTEEELAESNAETKKPKKKAPAAPKRNAKKKQRKEVETERALSSTSSSKKRKKAEGQAEETETQEPDVSTSNDKKKKREPHHRQPRQALSLWKNQEVLQTFPRQGWDCSNRWNQKWNEIPLTMWQGFDWVQVEHLLAGAEMWCYFKIKQEGHSTLYVQWCWRHHLHVVVGPGIEVCRALCNLGAQCGAVPCIVSNYYHA